MNTLFVGLCALHVNPFNGWRSFEVETPLLFGFVSVCWFVC